MSGLLSASVMLALGAGQARAEDWRALANSHHDVVFVDVDSVRRHLDGRIQFRSRHRLAENDSNRDFGYDRIDVSVEGRCERDADGQPMPAAGRRTYHLRGRPIPVAEWREEGLNDDLGSIAYALCRGRVGHRRFADLDKAMAEYAGHDSLERLAAHVTGEVDLVGTVVQGWEMNAVWLCGSEEGCREDSPRELCWLEGGIRVPAPVGAPEWVNGGPRRDSAGAAFRGRIHRARGDGGFGHMGGFACLVEVTGPVRFVEVPTRPDVPRDESAPGLGEEAIAAHRAFAEAVRAAGTVRLARRERSWDVDDFQPGSSGGACYSLPRFKGADPVYNAPLLGWRGLRRLSRDGAAVTLVDVDWDPDLSFHFPDPKAAAASEPFLRRLASRGVAAISQKGSKVAIRHPDGKSESFRFEDSAAAVRAAGMAEWLRGREIDRVERETNRVTATPLRRLSLTFPDEALAQRAFERMEALRAACAK
ncbi:MAG TPA: hypothetical protein VF759_18015 [Allosphingosinicella sp.]